MSYQFAIERAERDLSILGRNVIFSIIKGNSDIGLFWSERAAEKAKELEMLQWLKKYSRRGL